jgi:hypothetical protein
MILFLWEPGAGRALFFLLFFMNDPIQGAQVEAMLGQPPFAHVLNSNFLALGDYEDLFGSVYDESQRRSS